MDGSANYSGVSDGDSHSICKFNLLLLSTPTRCPERIKTNKSVLKDRFHTSFTRRTRLITVTQSQRSRFYL